MKTRMLGFIGLVLVCVFLAVLLLANGYPVQTVEVGVVATPVYEQSGIFAQDPVWSGDPSDYIGGDGGN